MGQADAQGAQQQRLDAQKLTSPLSAAAAIDLAESLKLKISYQKTQAKLSSKMIGLDWIGLDWIGLDWFGLVWIGYFLKDIKKPV